MSAFGRQTWLIMLTLYEDVPVYALDPLVLMSRGVHSRDDDVLPVMVHDFLEVLLVPYSDEPFS